MKNYSQQIKMVFFDIDETLFVKEKDYLPPSATYAIKKLKEKGIIPAIATGRARCSFPDKLNQFIAQEGLDLFVTMNGQWTEYQGKMLAKHPIATASLEPIIAFFEQHQIDYAFIANHEIYVSNPSPLFCETFHPITQNYKIDKNYYKNNEVFQLLAFYNEEKYDLVEQANIFEGLRLVRWHPHSIDIFDKEGSKARAIAAAAAHFGFSMENVMAFGDGLNDIEMLTQAGVGVAMGNAHPQLKAVADFVTETVEEDGIYHFLLKAGLID